MKDRYEEALSDCNGIMTKQQAIEWVEKHLEVDGLSVQDLKAFIRAGLQSYLKRP